MEYWNGTNTCKPVAVSRRSSRGGRHAQMAMMGEQIAVNSEISMNSQGMGQGSSAQGFMEDLMQIQGLLMKRLRIPHDDLALTAVCSINPTTHTQVVALISLELCCMWTPPEEPLDRQAVKAVGRELPGRWQHLPRGRSKTGCPVPKDVRLPPRLKVAAHSEKQVSRTGCTAPKLPQTPKQSLASAYARVHASTHTT
eukprot:1160142-Pelagomonas_calceolata.AAC.12